MVGSCVEEDIRGERGASGRRGSSFLVTVVAIVGLKRNQGSMLRTSIKPGSPEDIMILTNNQYSL